MTNENREQFIAETSERKYGRNVTVRNFWQRHAQKISGEVLNIEKTGLSSSSISTKGLADAREFGTTIEGKKGGLKGYVSSLDRTRETLDGVIEGYIQTNPEAPIRAKIRVIDELNPGTNPAWGLKFDVNKNKIMAERGLVQTSFSDLTADLQEEIAELAEEPVIAEWLDEPNSELAKEIPPRPWAAKFATLFDRHHRIANKLNNNSEIDLLHVTHKSVTEVFLVSGVLTRKSDGKRITSVADLGGSLKTLENWESEIQTDENGNGKIIVRLRQNEYEIDTELLNQLISEAKINEK